MYRLIILLLCSVSVYAQEPTYLPMKSNYQYKGIKMDSLFILPNLDTSNARKVTGALVRQSNVFYWYNGFQWTPLSNGGGANLQEVTDNGNTTTNDIQFTNDNDLLMDTFSAVLFANNSRLQEGYIDAGYGGNHGVALVCGLGYEYKWEGGRLFVMNNSGNQIREARYMFTDIPNNTHDYTKGYYVGSRWILDNGDTYVCTDNSLNAAIWQFQSNTFDSTSLSNRIDLRVKYTDTASMLLPYLRKVDTTSLSNRINDKIDSIRRIGTQVSFKKNGTWYNAFIDSTGSTNGFVPYTGATQDVDLGANGLNAKNIKITGTAGNGHIDLKHQSGDATGQANSTKLYANSQGYLKWKNDNLYYSTLAMPQTADRVYTFENKSYTLGDSADIAARVKYTDTATMLSSYLRKADTLSLSNRINAKPNLNATSTYIPYREGSSFMDSYLVNDTTGKVLKSVFIGNDIGLKLDFANDIYNFGDFAGYSNECQFVVDNQNQVVKTIKNNNDIGLKLDFLNNEYKFGDYNFIGNGSLLTLNSTNQYAELNTVTSNLICDGINEFIKTQYYTNDIGLKLDFANNNYNIGTSTNNFQVKNDSLKINGLIGQSSDSVVNITNSGKLGKVSIAGKLNVSDTANMLRNYQRTSAFPVATFGAGSGAAGDTSAFSTSALYGSFYLNAGADTIIVTGYTGVVQGTSASVTPTIWFNDSLNVTAGATKIVNSPSAVTSTTTGNTVTSLDNTKIPPGNFVWVTTGTVTTKPTYFNLTLIGYRKR